MVSTFLISSKRLALALVCLTVGGAAFSIDKNGNGLSDIWEQRFNAGSLTQLGDKDGDGFTNVEECMAGTDPFDANSKILLTPAVSQSPERDLFLEFETVEGKQYLVQTQYDLTQPFVDLSSVWLGDGLKRELFVDEEGIFTTRSPARFEFWADVAGTSIDALDSHPTYPDEPDGVLYRKAPTAPVFLASGYAARMTTTISVPVTGYYRLYLSSGGPAELYIQKDGVEAQEKLLEVLPTQAGLQPGEWNTYGTQQTELMLLDANEPFRVELRYLATVPSQHCALAWSGPGISGIQPLGSESLAQIVFRSFYLPRQVLLEKTYEEVVPATPLWPVNTTLEPAPVGMTGTVERVTQDIGNTSAESVVFDATSPDHLYATFLYNMATGHDDLSVLLNGGVSGSLEGPRIRLESRSSASIAAVRAGGSSGTEVQIDTRFDHTYRVEVVSTLSEEGFEYMTPQGPESVAKERFDLYVSDTSGHLIGSAQGLTFRDSLPDTLSVFAAMRVTIVNLPNVAFDDFEVTSGQISGQGYLIANHTLDPPEDTGDFYTLLVDEVDQDGDGLPDWEELELGKYNEVLFFDDDTVEGTSDLSTLDALIDSAQGVPEISLFATDADAYESNFPNTIPNHGEITLVRTGSLTPLTVKLCVAPLENTGSVATVCNGICCSLVGSAGDEEAEPEDYRLFDEEGNAVTDTVTFAFGETMKKLRVEAVNDPINEYPETLNLAAEAPVDSSYTLSSTMNGASIQLFDLPDSADNLTIFTGTFSQDGNAVIASNGSGFVTATINGPRTEVRIWDEFSGLTSAQQDSHVHKANTGNTPGPIVYSITETPGDETTDPLNGPLVNYLWDLSNSSGAVPSGGGSASKQVIIDSLFGQNNESPLYVNIHTVDNPAGEIWAFLNLSGGSSQDPGDAAPAAAPGTVEYPLLAGAMLEAEVRRFLNQATFGATDGEVAALLQQIEQTRLSNPNYHRTEAFSDWIDAQMTTVDQTYLLEYTLATQFQFMKLANLFDPILNPSNAQYTTPTLPTQWPIINRSNPNPEHWYLDGGYPATRDDFRLADANDINVEPSNRQRREAHWQMMINAQDQLRQKMGFALQQIVVVSDSLDTIEDSPLGTANYQDMLNTHAFSHYRDVLGYVNWSPLMGKWLSSLQNQRAIDFDGDGLYDAFPDENLARENMQLFSIGLFDIWSDGSLRLSPEGLPRSTYTNEDIREFAKVLTGQSFSRVNGYNSGWGGSPFVADNDEFDVSQNANGVLGISYLYPMKMFGEFHSPGPKTFAGVSIDNSSLNDTTLEGIADIEAAIDWLAGKPNDGKPDFDMVNSHVSTPAFISRRLIQRFTTSNPSSEYLHRVATVFKATEGHLGDTLRAILLDPEARTLDVQNTTFGMKKSPLEGYLQVLRSLEAYTYLPLVDPQGAVPFDQAPGSFASPDLYLTNFGYPATQLDNQVRNVRFLMGDYDGSGSGSLQMNPFGQETVFNYYLPDYTPGGAIGNAGLVSPEMQLATEQGVVRNINFFHSLLRYGNGYSGDELGGTNDNQVAVFGGVAEASQNDAHRIGRLALADAFYPATEPASQVTNPSANGYTSSQWVSNTTSPVWLRLTRTGNVFVASHSTDGVTWAQAGVITMDMASEAYVGFAVTSHNDGVLTTANFSNVSVVGGQGTWFNQDIGTVDAAGSSTQTSGTSFQIEASGRDIWSDDDECHYTYQQITGDVDIITRVDSLGATDPWAKAGVMIREGLHAEAANVFMLVTVSNGTRTQLRDIPRGRTSESLADEALVDALDLRLTNGLFKVKYPYNPNDDDDPNVFGPDKLLQNPREMIIDAITQGYGNPYNGSNDDYEREYKLADALYLLTFSPEFQIKK